MNVGWMVGGMVKHRMCYSLRIMTKGDDNGDVDSWMLMLLKCALFVGLVQCSVCSV
jgi:hypothetical protein